MAKRPKVEIVETLTLTELCEAGGFRAAWIVELTEHGAIEPAAAADDAPRFSPADAAAAIRAWRLHRDLGVNAAGAALALSLIEERDRLARRLRLLEGVEG
ncbi:MAG: chaperone modulator CbpM [Pseudomonadota bacterium]